MQQSVHLYVSPDLAEQTADTQSHKLGLYKADQQHPRALSFTSIPQKSGISPNLHFYQGGTSAQ